MVSAMDPRGAALRAYHDRNRRAGLPPGMTRLQTEFGGITGPWFWWPHFAPEDLQAEACGAGWQVELLVRDEIGQYLGRLARLTR